MDTKNDPKEQFASSMIAAPFPVPVPSPTAPPPPSVPLGTEVGEEAAPVVVEAEVVQGPDSEQPPFCKLSGNRCKITMVLFIIIVVLATTIYSSNDRPTAPTIGPSEPTEDTQIIALGGYHTCAVFAGDESRVSCWGRNESGQIGDTKDINRRSTPTSLSLGYGNGPLQIGLGEYHSCVIASDNRVMCWGLNMHGQLGDGTTTMRNTPTRINLGPDQMRPTQISLGWRHTCIIQYEEWLMCWGDNWYEQLGDGTRTSRSIPTRIHLVGSENGTTTVYSPRQISVGGYHTCVIASDDSVMCWGLNSSGQLGDGTTTTRGTPTKITNNLGSEIRPTQIALGGRHTCIIANTSSVMCWGNNGSGQLGDGTTIDRNEPKSISFGLSSLYLTQIALGGSHTCVITSDDEVLCWGDNRFGQLGDGTVTNRNTPTRIDIGDEVRPKRIALGEYHTCVTASDESVMCWGHNEYGQLGDGTTEDRAVPVRVTH